MEMYIHVPSKPYTMIMFWRTKELNMWHHNTHTSSQIADRTRCFTVCWLFCVVRVWLVFTLHQLERI